MTLQNSAPPKMRRVQEVVDEVVPVVGEAGGGAEAEVVGINIIIRSLGSFVWKKFVAQWLSDKRNNTLPHFMSLT